MPELITKANSTGVVGNRHYLRHIAKSVLLPKSCVLMKVAVLMEQKQATSIHPQKKQLAPHTNLLLDSLSLGQALGNLFKKHSLKNADSNIL